MTMTRTAAALAAVALLAGAACKSSSSGPSNARAFCQDLIDAELQRMAECDAGGAPPEIYAMMADCGGFGEAQEAGRVTYDQSLAEACLDEIRSTSCWELQLPSADLFRLSESCRAAVAPQVEAGDPCTNLLGIECVDGYCSFPSYDACFAGGTCAPRIAPAEACEPFVTDPCMAGSSCQYTCVDDVCQNRCTELPVIQAAGEGEVCDGVPCLDAYYCQGAVEGPPTCQLRAVRGASCEVDPCEFGTVCVMGTCIAPLQAGADCSSAPCGTGLYCNEQSVCARHPRVGEPCPVSQPNALAGVRVDSTTCVDSWCDASGETPVCAPYRDHGSVCGLQQTFEDWVLSCGPGYLCVEMDTVGICARSYCPFFR